MQAATAATGHAITALAVLGALLTACGAPPPPGQVMPEPPEAASGTRNPAGHVDGGGALQLRFADGLITVRADRVELGALLAELERQGALRLVSRDALRDKVSFALERAPLIDVLRLALGTRGFLLLEDRTGSKVFVHAAYRPDADASQAVQPGPGGEPQLLEALAALPRAAMPAEVQAMATLAASDARAAVREEAVAMLADAGDDAGRAAITNALSDPDPGVRGAALRALGRSGDAVALPTLRWALEQADEEQRLVALDAIGRIGGTAGLAALRHAAQHEDPRVRAAASDWLEEYAGTETGAILSR